MPSPQRLGEFEILSRLGSGATSVVYRARRPGAAEDVALKLARSALDPLTLRRFLREGEAAAGLRHPGVVSVRSTGEVDGVPYVAYELVEDAVPLDLAWRSWERTRRVRAVREAAEALGAAHAAGLVHRDVKPDNVLVDATGRVRVADFGLAWRADLDSLTQSRALLGTPLYMAPEVWSAPGRSARRQPSLDVWSLGVILYEALVDRHPYAEGADSAVRLLGNLQRGLRPPRATRADVPAALDAACMRALAHDPRQRYPNAACLAADLAAWERAGTATQPARRVAATLAGVVITLGLLGLLCLAAVGPRFARQGQTPQAAARPSGPARPPAPARPIPPAPGRPQPAAQPIAVDPSAAEAPIPKPPAPAGTLSANPNPAIAPPGTPLGATTLSWSTATRPASVWVFAADARDGKLFSGDRAGEQQVSWIRPGQLYTFKLFAGSEPAGAPLAEVTVLGPLPRW